MRKISAAVLGLVLLTGNAMADDRFDGLKKMNTDLCISAGTHIDGAPKDAKLVKPYCNCVTESYWDSVPKSEIQELLTAGTSKGIRDNLQKRMDAAKALCRKKVGF